MGKRAALFISHANPEDNTFTIWLGAKLASRGYEVWADVMRLRGGDDWQRKLESALRDRTCKVLLAANPVSVAKQGVRNEIQIATEVAKRISDHEFIIPLRLAPFDSPFLIAHAQYIDFTKGWSRGLSELLKTLEDGYRVPRAEVDESELWRALQLIHAKEVIEEPEKLISNWLAIEELPPLLRCYDFATGISIGHSKARLRDCPWAAVPFNRGFLSFAPLDELQDHFGPELPLKAVGELATNDFLEAGWDALGIPWYGARVYFADLFRRAADASLRSRGFYALEMANDRLAWWAPGDLVPRTKISFRWGDVAGQRQIQGYSAKRGVRWHFGISVNARSTPLPHVRVTSRLIFTEDGLSPFDKDRMHRLRRSFAKAWRNARWRDMLLAFLWRLSDGQERLAIPTSRANGIVLRLPPMAFIAPIRMRGAGIETDDDDPSDDETPDEFEPGPGEDDGGGDV